MVMRVCARCALPAAFPGIQFDAGGLCTHCQQFAVKQGNLAEDRVRYALKFQNLLETVRHPDQRKRRSYDILMAYSGGKDSTYTMILLKKKYDLRVLAVSVDNGFTAAQAADNIKMITDVLGIDHILFKPRWDLLRRIFSAAAERELYPKTTLVRASTICTSCMAIVKAVCLKMAIDQDIPLIGYGWSPGQAPVQSSIMKNNPPLIRASQQAVLVPLRGVAGAAVETYFLTEAHFACPDRFPANVHPLAWEFNDEETIFEEIRKYGWLAPKDTDANSTNCLLNGFANDVHRERYGFHPYAWEISSMIRQGIMTREHGLAKLEIETPSAQLRSVREKLARGA